MSTLKVDLYPEEVYTFTPRGKVIVLPRDATPIDFAYAIHSRRRQYLRGRKVNGRIVPLKYNAEEWRRGGDSDAARPHAEQGLARAGQDVARAQQDQARHQRDASAPRRSRSDRNTWKRKRAASACRWAGSPRADLEAVAAEYGVSKMEDLYAALGYGRFSARQVLQKLAPETVQAKSRNAAAPPAPADDPRAGLAGRRRRSCHHVKGVDDVMVYRAKCCNPIRGEVDRRLYHPRQRRRGAFGQCTNVQNLMYEVERKIDVEWARSGRRSRSRCRSPFIPTTGPDAEPAHHRLLTENSNIRSLEARGDEQDRRTAR